jgi:hypothetical protein
MAVLAAAAVCLAAPAAAQTPEAAEETVATPRRFAIAATGGASAVQKIGGAAGGELSVRLTDRFTVFGEGLWMRNVVTRRRLDLARTVAEFLQNTQGHLASSDVVVPAAYAGAGVRVHLATKGMFAMYGTANAGAARVALQPVFVLGGVGITSVLPAYGVTLGRDLTGETTAAAFGGGAGVRIPRGRWFIDGGVRMLSIRTPGQPTNVIRATGGLGWEF